MKNIAFYLLLTATLFACNGKRKTRYKQNQPMNQAWDTSQMDTSVVPGDDFYEYVNGGWLKNTTIPSDESSWGIFKQLRKKNDLRVKEILKELSSGGYTEGTPEQQAGDFYFSGMDSTTIEKKGISGLNDLLEMAEKIKTPSDILFLHVELQKSGGHVLFNLSKDADMKNSKVNALYISQAGLGLPERDYYLDSSPRFEGYRNQYKKHISRMLVLAGTDSVSAKTAAEKIVGIELALAKKSMGNVDMRDPYKIYNKLDRKELEAFSHNIHWNEYLASTGTSHVSYVVIGQTGFLKGLDSMLVAIPIENWKWYFRFHILSAYADFLPEAYVLEDFSLYGKTLMGKEKPKERGERITQLTNGLLGEAVGKIYVKKYFTEEAKAGADSLVNNLKTAFTARVQNLSWMSDSTKQKALYKLDRIIRKIGYPDKWKDYSKVYIKRDDFLGNVIRLNRFEFEDQMKKTGKPVDKTEWYMPPQTVNAYYNPSFNEIVFPAAILQPPFFDPKADDALNYGGIGAVIGHELTHGFDDQGGRFDAGGNLKNWWTKEDMDRFKARSKGLVKQYSAYKVLDSIPVNGELTLGENIADLGGISIAHDALQLALKGKKAGLIQGFTPQQRLFLSWARVWCGKAKDDALVNQVKSDPHSPLKFRAVGPLVNLDVFYAAFNVLPENMLFKADSVRVKIW